MGEVVKIGDVIVPKIADPECVDLYGTVVGMYEYDNSLFTIKWSDGFSDSAWDIKDAEVNWKTATKLDLYLRGIHDKV